MMDLTEEVLLSDSAKLTGHGVEIQQHVKVYTFGYFTLKSIE